MDEMLRCRLTKAQKKVGYISKDLKAFEVNSRNRGPDNTHQSTQPVKSRGRKGQLRGHYKNAQLEVSRLQKKLRQLDVSQATRSRNPEADISSKSRLKPDTGSSSQSRQFTVLDNLSRRVRPPIKNSKRTEELRCRLENTKRRIFCLNMELRALDGPSRLQATQHRNSDVHKLRRQIKNQQKTGQRLRKALRELNDDPSCVQSIHYSTPDGSSLCQSSGVVETANRNHRSSSQARQLGMPENTACNSQVPSKQVKEMDKLNHPDFIHRPEDKRIQTIAGHPGAVRDSKPSDGRIPQNSECGFYQLRQPVENDKDDYNRRLNSLCSILMSGSLDSSPNLAKQNLPGGNSISSSRTPSEQADCGAATEKGKTQGKSSLIGLEDNRKGNLSSQFQAMEINPMRNKSEYSYSGNTEQCVPAPKSQSGNEGLNAQSLFSSGYVKPETQLRQGNGPSASVLNRTQILQASTSRQHQSDLQKVGFSYLWRGVQPTERDKSLYNTLKVIYGRLQAGEDGGVITPHTIRNVCDILENDKHASYVKCVLCHVLNKLCVSEGTARLFLKSKLLYCMQKLLKKWTDHTQELTEIDSLLLDAELAALETISKHSAPFLPDFVSAGIPSTLCLLCAPHCAATFKYGPQAYAAFRKLTAGVYPGLAGHVALAHSDLRDEVYAEYFGDEVPFACLKLPETVFSVRLYNTAEEQDVDVAAEMRTCGATWPTMEDTLPVLRRNKDKNESESEREWRDVYVTSIIDGCRFWAQLGGKESFAIVARIDQILSDWLKKWPLAVPPTVGDVLAMKDKVLGYFRCQVISVNDGQIEVHALDYGSRRTLNWDSEDVFEVVPEMGLSEYQPQAILCMLSDISPPPLNVSIVHSLVSILRNLAAESKTVFAPFSAVEYIRLMQYLSVCPDPSIVKLAAQALTNLANGDIIRHKLNTQQTLPVLIVKLKEYIYKMDDEAVARAAYSIMGAITNLLHNNPENREEFYLSKGLPLCITLAGSGYPDQVRAAARRVLAMFVGNAVPNVVIDLVQSRRKFPVNRTAFGQLQDSIAALGMYRPNSGVRNRQRGIDTEPTGILGLEAFPSDKKSAALSKDIIEQGEEEDDEDLLMSLVGKKRRQQKLSDGGDTSEGEALDALSVSFAAAGDGEVQGLDTATVYKKFSKKQYYVQGRTVQFKNDSTHDIRPFEKVQFLTKEQITYPICGLLNSGEGGSIYMGLRQTGVVNGVFIERDLRDSFRLSIDQLMTRLIPTVPHTNFEVHYHQVVEHNQETDDFRRVPELFVVEMKVAPAMDMWYTLSNGAVILRTGDKTEEITMQDVHARTVIETEQKKLSEIETLEKELSIWMGRLT